MIVQHTRKQSNFTLTHSFVSKSIYYSRSSSVFYSFNHLSVSLPLSLNLNYCIYSNIFLGRLSPLICSTRPMFFFVPPYALFMHLKTVKMSLFLAKVNSRTLEICLPVAAPAKARKVSFTS